MTQPRTQTTRELDSRTGDGINVCLLWHPSEDRVSVGSTTRRPARRSSFRYARASVHSTCSITPRRTRRGRRFESFPAHPEAPRSDSQLLRQPGGVEGFLASAEGVDPGQLPRRERVKDDPSPLERHSADGTWKQPRRRRRAARRSGSGRLRRGSAPAPRSPPTSSAQYLARVPRQLGAVTRLLNASRRGCAQVGR
jgi:hypothetical protein